MSRCKCAPVFAQQMLTYKVNPVFPTAQGKALHTEPRHQHSRTSDHPLVSSVYPPFPSASFGNSFHHGAISRRRGQAAVRFLGYTAGERWSRCRHQPGAGEVEASISGPVIKTALSPVGRLGDNLLKKGNSLISIGRFTTLCLSVN